MCFVWSVVLLIFNVFSHSTMAGRPFKVGRFAHTLRVRLMREHLGIDVDGLDEDDLVGPADGVDGVQPEDQQTPWDPSQEQVSGDQEEVTYVKNHHQKYPVNATASHLYDTVKQGMFGAVYSALPPPCFDGCSY